MYFVFRNSFLSRYRTAGWVTASNVLENLYKSATYAAHINNWGFLSADTAGDATLFSSAWTSGFSSLALVSTAPATDQLTMQSGRVYCIRSHSAQVVRIHSATQIKWLQFFVVVPEAPANWNLIANGLSGWGRRGWGEREGQLGAVLGRGGGGR